MTSDTPVHTGATPSAENTSKAAVKSAFSAYYVDMLDIYLPILILAPAIGYFVSPNLGPAGTAIASATIFVGTLLGRPVGAAVFGGLADTWGRKRVAVLTMGASGATTIVMGLILGHQQWGAMAVVIFVALRFLNGIFIGGQYTASNPLAMELAPKRKRGLYSAAINCGFPAAYITVAFTAMGLLAVLPSDGLDSPYVQWGWRLPFLAVGLLEILVTIYYAASVEESEVWKEQQSKGREGPKPSPLRALASGETRKTFLQVFILMSGLWLALQSVAAILPGVLTESVDLTPNGVTLVLVVAYVVLIGANLGAGTASQKHGRRSTLMTLGLLVATVGTTLYFVLIREGSDLTLPVLLALVAVIVCIVDSPFALSIAYINERFQVGERASGYGLSYSLSVVLPSFYAYYQLGLSAFMPFEYTVLALLVVGGALICLGAALGPETKDVDFGATVPEPRQPRHQGPAVTEITETVDATRGT
ncbi:MAG: MFS transporter [Nocardioides sp.]|nr:MFS transporter [Nocardioides sp.]